MTPTAEPTYFDWLCSKVYEPVNGKDTYSKLLKRLYDTEFVYRPFDDDRAKDGIALRYSYRDQTGKNSGIIGECNLLEMMVALVDRYENSTMANVAMGNRTGQWFWGMIASLGLGRMTDDRYDDDEVMKAINRFETNSYEANGSGGLFTLANPPGDMTKIPIIVQINYFMTEVLEDEGILERRKS